MRHGPLPLIILSFVGITAVTGFGLVMPLAWGQAAPRGLTLDEVFRVAVQRADTLAIDSEVIQQAEAVYKEATGAMLPTINGSYSVTKQKDVRNGLGSSIAPSYQPLAKITATQPLFAGLKDFAALRQTKHLAAAAKLDRDAAVVQLYKDVATNFFTIVAAEKDLLNIDTELEYYRKRIAELERFRRIGRSQATDVLTVQTAQATLMATGKQLKGQIQAARQIFSVLTLLDAQTPLQVQLRDELPKDFAPLATFLQRIDQRPEIAAADMRTKSAQEGIQIARGGHLPSVALTGNYYLQRTGIQKDVTWDVMLAATMPIYSGGIVSSQVEAAGSVQRQSQDVMNQARHNAEQEVRSDYVTVQADQEQLAALKVAVELARKNYEAQAKNFRLGLVTNLDVLNALTVFQENQRSLDRQRHALLLDLEKLQAASGLRPLAFNLSVPPAERAAPAGEGGWP